LDAGIEVVHVPGLAVNRAREGSTGGERKSDQRDAAVIADQVRHRRDLRAIEPTGELDAEIRLLVARRREQVTDQTRRIGRLRDLLASIHPGLERVVDPTTKAGQQLLGRYVTRGEIRRAGRRRLIEHILRAGRIARRHPETLADQALAAAAEQTITVAGERVAAELVLVATLEILHADRQFPMCGPVAAELTAISSPPATGALDPLSARRGCPRIKCQARSHDNARGRPRHNLTPRQRRRCGTSLGASGASATHADRRDQPSRPEVQASGRSPGFGPRPVSRGPNGVETPQTATLLARTLTSTNILICR
jgi:hypothetical protein